MHTTRTFILRLFINLDAPDSLRGSVQTLVDKESHPFTNEEMLAALLHQLVNEAAGEILMHGSVLSEEDDLHGSDGKEHPSGLPGR